jgi:hypothetical protein
MSAQSRLSSVGIIFPKAGRENIVAAIFGVCGEGMTRIHMTPHCWRDWSFPALGHVRLAG